MSGEPDDRPMPERRNERSARSFLLEGLVIVGSILLAFAIDAGWDELRDGEQERRILDQLADEMDLYIDQLGPAAFRNTDRVEANIRWLLDAIHGPQRFDPTAWNERLNRLTGGYQFSAATPVFDLLTADGGLARISDPAIRDKLAQVSAFLSLVRRFEALDAEFIAGELSPWLNRSVDRYAIRKGADDAWLDRPESRFGMDEAELRTREFSNLLVERQNRISLVIMFRRIALERMTELRKMIRGGGGE